MSSTCRNAAAGRRSPALAEPGDGERCHSIARRLADSDRRRLDPSRRNSSPPNWPNSRRVASFRRARRRALQSRDRWLTRQALFTHSQSELIARVGEALPSSASLWQRYDYQPGRLQIFLLDPSPDPRDYVRRLDETAMVDSVQVQPEPRNGMVTLQAVPFAHGGEQ